MEERNRIYYKSDFDFIINIGGLANNAEGVADLDFEGVVQSELRGGKVFRFSRVGNVWINCSKAEQGASHRCAKGMDVRVTCDSHSLPPGPLSLELTVHFPDNAYPDGCRKQVCRHPLPIELVAGECDCNTVSPSSIAVTLPYVWASAYDLASANGYEGTQEEYNTALTELPAVVDTARMVESMLTDVAHGKAELADTLRRAGQDVADDAPLPVMAEAVRSLNLTPEDAPQGSAVTFADFGMSAPVNLLNVLHTHQRAGYEGWFGVALNSVAVTLAGADAYLTSDGVWTEEPGRVEFSRLYGNWVIYYFREAEYSMPDLSGVSGIDELVVYGGIPKPGATSEIRRGVFVPTGLKFRLDHAKIINVVVNSPGGVYSDSISSSLQRFVALGERTISNLGDVRSLLSYELPESVEHNGGCYSCISLQRFYAPKLRRANSLALINLSSLASVELPCAEEVSVDGFRNCNTKEIAMPMLRRIAPIGWKSGPDSKGLIEQMGVLKELNLPQLVEAAGYLVSNCNVLESLTLPCIETLHNGKNWISNVPKLATVNLGAQQEGRVEFPSLPSVTTITVQPGYRQTLNIASLTNLTAECLTQLIMNLGDNNDRDTVTLTLGSANLAKLSDDDISAAQAKNFTLA